MIRAIIIDDEESGIDMLKIMASRHPAMIKIIASTVDPEEGIKCIENYKPDVVFLDISMPTMNGFDVLSKFDVRDFKLVFTTAHKEYAIEAIKNKAYDYLLKPVSTEDFKKCIEALYHEKNSGVLPSSKTTPSAPVEIQVKDGIIYIRQKDIVRLEASRSYTEFYLDNGQKHVASRTLREFESWLDTGTFYRCHKSHIINLKKVQKFIHHQGLFALMSDGSMTEISKGNKEEFLELLKLS